MLPFALSALSTLWGWLKNPYVAIVVGLAVLCGLVYWHNSSLNHTITKQAATIAVQQGTIKSDKAVIVEKDDSAKREVTHTIIHQQILSAPKAANEAKDGAIPPVLLHTFDSLRDAHSNSR